MTLSALDWRRRFIQQATWTRELRQFLYRQVELSQAKLVLDVGCGPGALETELHTVLHGQVVGLDIASNYLALAKEFSPQCIYVQGDVHQLPFPDRVFDVCLCHFLLLWLEDPLSALKEMRRICQPAGWVLILAEPDYTGRLDYPPELAQLATWQRQSLIQQGADPSLGRRLAVLCQRAGLKDVQYGVLGGQWKARTDVTAWENEWQVLENDLARLSPPPPSHKVAGLRELDLQASQNGERILFVPTFYAWGRAS